MQGMSGRRSGGAFGATLASLASLVAALSCCLPLGDAADGGGVRGSVAVFREAAAVAAGVFGGVARVRVRTDLRAAAV
ncbi:exported hypothetical protein [Candidatus Sulfopaludibacter sp. SbA3]|nr:exported hypothetical protein [Candidatus Sulfopaludibacter sp. SbA3]